MNFQFYFEKLEHSDNFKDFVKENKDAFLCSGFFSVDKRGQKDVQNIDYFVPSLNKMFSFKINEDVEKVPVEDFGDKFKQEKISEDINFEFEEIEDMIQERMNQDKIKNKIEKLLYSLQAKEGKNYVLGTVFISGLGLLKVRIDLKEKRIVDFEKKSLLDMMKIIKK